MSLINRMLRDLSSRQPGAGNVMTGIQLPEESRPRGGPLQRLAMLAVLVVVFTAGLWFVFGPKAIKPVQPRGLTPAATAAGAPASAVPPAMPETMTTTAPPSPTMLKMETQLSDPGARPAPARAKPRATAPAAAPATTSRAETATRAPAPTAPARSTQSGDELYAQARRALERGDDAAAEPLLVQALAANPSLHAAREDLGNLRIRQDRLGEAEDTTRVGLDLAPTWTGYRRLAARIELARNRPDNAVAVLQRDPPPLERDLEYHGLLASAYQRVGRHDQAAQIYRELMRVQPQEANWWAGYAMSRDAAGDVNGALTAYAQARQLGGLAPNVLEHINRRTAALQAGR
jgi:MSHA biogenesis protein MshN